MATGGCTFQASCCNPCLENDHQFNINKYQHRSLTVGTLRGRILGTLFNSLLVFHTRHKSTEVDREAAVGLTSLSGLTEALINIINNSSSFFYCWSPFPQVGILVTQDL